jgi:hypothetical protein
MGPIGVKSTCPYLPSPPRHPHCAFLDLDLCQDFFYFSSLLMEFRDSTFSVSWCNFIPSPLRLRPSSTQLRPRQ